MPPAWLSAVGRWCTLLLSSVVARLQAGMRAWLLWVVSAGPIPSHIAFIMDGNRRFADRLHIKRHMGHSHGYDALLRTLKDCYDLHVKTVTLFAFSIDNFQRPLEEVSALMDLMQTKLEALIEKEGLASEYGIRVQILGDLSLLPHGARIAAEKAMAVTSKNSSAVLNLCISYTSTHEIVQSIQGTFDNVVNALGTDGGSHGDSLSKVVKECVSEEEIEKHLYTDCCPPPDLLVRTSGETRLSNFLLWQTSFAHLAFCKVLWPDFSFRHLLLIILEYQRGFSALFIKRQHHYSTVQTRKGSIFCPRQKE